MPLRGKLKPQDEYKIRTNYKYLVDEIDAQFLVPFLYAKNVISSDDKEEIYASVRRGSRNELLLSKILHSGNGDSYKFFLESLKEEYPFIVEELEKESENAMQSPSPYSWFTQVSPAIKNHVLQDRDATRIASALGDGWEALMYRINIKPVEIEHEKARCSNNILNITHLLIKWRHKLVANATIDTLMRELMDIEDAGRIMTIDWEKLKEVIESIET